jgi:Immunity protein 53
MKTGLSIFEEWYAARCDGDWEHSWGILKGGDRCSIARARHLLKKFPA